MKKSMPGSLLELFILFNIHTTRTEREREKRLLDTKPTLQSEMAMFNATLRQVAIFCCDEEYEDLFKPCRSLFTPCRSPRNRLKELAVGNKLACIQGTPDVSEEDAASIAVTILWLKGRFIKPQRKPHCSWYPIQNTVNLCVCVGSYAKQCKAIAVSMYPMQNT